MNDGLNLLGFSGAALNWQSKSLFDSAKRWGFEEKVYGGSP